MTAVKSAQLFIDMLQTTSRVDIDYEAGALLYELRQVLLPSRLPESNVTHFNIDWVGNEGLEYNSHSQYLQQFSETFYQQVRESFIQFS